MENKQESRIEILDRLSKKWGSKDNIQTFDEFCMFYDSKAITTLVYMAMDDYNRQDYFKKVIDNSKIKDIIEKYDSDLKNSTMHYQFPRKFTIEEWLEENL
jgi:hypothetical protein